MMWRSQSSTPPLPCPFGNQPIVLLRSTMMVSPSHQVGTDVPMTVPSRTTLSPSRPRLLAAYRPSGIPSIPIRYATPSSCNVGQTRDAMTSVTGSE
jgi:hypothetical protein